MKFSENWLRSWIDPGLTTAELVEQLTLAGLEVDAIEAVAAGFSKVVVGEILGVEPHPNADKLSLCKVNVGAADNLQIVCGADNARAGLKAPVALVGGELPGDFKIKQAKLRGVESSGMLCAGEELGIEGQGDGLWELPDDAPVGADLVEWLGLDDHSIEVDLTPNRADCLGILGLAREVSVLNDMSFERPNCSPVDAEIDERRPIELSYPQGCPRYLGRVIKGVDMQCATPLWMQERLRRCGLRSIDPVVDVTNYVLLELGQPLHAFDLAQLSEGIEVRLASQGESLKLLDEREVELTPDSMVIADASGPLALAGIMGGDRSGVSDSTQDIFLECAYFNPEALAGRARAYGLHTDASHRYERGVDPELAHTAMERATRLLLDIVGGQAGPIEIANEDQQLPTQPEITLRKSRLELLSGLSFEAERVGRILTSLGCEVIDSSADEWRVRPPSWRFDLAIEVDLIEELTRIVGYDKIPETPLEARLEIQPQTETRRAPERLTQQLVARGYREAITYSFIDPQLCRQMGFTDGLVDLSNPIASDMSVMRPSLLPGLVRAVKYNLDRQEPRARLFETGLRFAQEGGEIQQISTLALVAAGSLYPEQWRDKGGEVGFFDVKMDVQALLAEVSGEIEWQPLQDMPCLHPGRSALIKRNGATLGWLGELHPQLQQGLDIDDSMVLCELDMEPLLLAEVPSFEPLARYPSVRRDLALVVDKEVSAQAVIDTVRSIANNLLREARIFDIYTGQGIDSNKKSMALSLTFRDSSRTLNDQEVAAFVDEIVEHLTAQLGAVLRQ